jgi:hypothetical protein
MSNAVGHFGTFDFQRTRTPSGGTVFTSAYTNAANFAVGVYLAGAGFGQSTAGLISDTYALVNSKNFGDPNQETFRNAGIAAANGKGVACH